MHLTPRLVTYHDIDRMIGLTEEKGVHTTPHVTGSGRTDPADMPKAREESKEKKTQHFKAHRTSDVEHDKPTSSHKESIGDKIKGALHMGH